MNVLNAMPKSVQAKAKGHLHDIWQAETRGDAEAAFDFFVTTYGVKYDKAVGKLTKDRDLLLAFYGFPAEHWKHIRATNPIESPGLRPFRAELIHWINSKTPFTLRHGPPSDRQNQRLSQPKNWPRYGIQADDPSRDIAAQYPARQWSAQTKWRKLDGANRMPEIIEGIAFKDGIKQLIQAA